MSSPHGRRVTSSHTSSDVSATRARFGGWLVTSVSGAGRADITNINSGLSGRDASSPGSAAPPHRGPSEPGGRPCRRAAGTFPPTQVISKWPFAREIANRGSLCRARERSVAAAPAARRDPAAREPGSVRHDSPPPSPGCSYRRSGDIPSPAREISGLGHRPGRSRCWQRAGVGGTADGALLGPLRDTAPEEKQLRTRPG